MATRSLKLIWPVLPIALLLAIFFVVPMTLVLPEGFRSAGGWTTAVYAGVFGDSYYWTIFARSFWLSIVGTAVCLAASYPVAYYLVRIAHPRWRPYAYMLVIAPLFTSAVIRAMAWVIILGRKGVVNEWLQFLGVAEGPLRLLYGEGAIVLGLVYVMVPLMVLTFAAVLQTVDTRLEDAARDLGAGPLATFCCVTLPLTVPGIIAGSFLVFTLCLSSYVTPAVLGGGRTKVLAMLVFEQFMRVFNWPLGAALATILLIISIALMWLYNRVLARGLGGGRREAAL
jgi:putative spermidine/putrescine transport system permease protein